LWWVIDYRLLRTTKPMGKSMWTRRHACRTTGGMLDGVMQMQRGRMAKPVAGLLTNDAHYAGRRLYQVTP